jgi:hypothetical protein
MRLSYVHSTLVKKMSTYIYVNKITITKVQIDLENFPLYRTGYLKIPSLFHGAYFKYVLMSSIFIHNVPICTFM